MKASLDTNIIIHLYRANLQNVLFEIFTEGVFIYEQIRDIELGNHGESIIPEVDADITAGKIELYTDDKLKEQSVYKMFQINVKENRLLYGTGDLGEVYAMSLAQTIGAYSLVTDDIKQGGPYMSLLQLEYDIKPFNFADILILRYLLGITNASQTIKDFNTVNNVSNLNWSFKSQLIKFVKRFLKDPYCESEKQWFLDWTSKNNIDVTTRLKALKDHL